ncbi:hypothetical protein ACFYW9_41165 [Streptomyces sp. NPDC002698]|uniref:hypothetical protein n=1 Tax=Streptomyces sp. NPDC002698 TaxID=3364660 RepID=UPI003691CA99
MTEAADGLAAGGAAVVRARWLTVSRPKPLVPPFRPDAAHARHPRTAVMHSHLDVVRGRGQVQGADFAAVAQGIGDEIQDHQNHGFDSLCRDRRPEVIEEAPGAHARASAAMPWSGRLRR